MSAPQTMQVTSSEPTLTRTYLLSDTILNVEERALRLRVSEALGAYLIHLLGERWSTRNLSP